MGLSAKTGLSAFARLAFSRHAPEPLLRLVKRNHYLNLIRTFNEEKERDLKVVRRLICKNNLVIDIGANFGIYSHIMAEVVGDDGMVYSFEPIPETFDVLRYCVKKLKRSNIVPVNCAVSDNEGVVQMVVPKYEKGGDNFYRASIGDENVGSTIGLRKYEITGTTIDSWFSGKQRRSVSFVKIDVEGHEERVIAGAAETIRSSKPALLVEIGCSMNLAGCYGVRITERLREYGYERFWFDGTHLRRDVSPEEVANYFFLQDHHRLSLQETGELLFSQESNQS